MGLSRGLLTWIPRFRKDAHPHEQGDDTMATQNAPQDYRQDYDKHFRNNYESTNYYQQGRTWNDYEPAYKYGYDQYSTTYRGRDFNEVEGDLERGWEKAKADSRLAWSEAMEAIKDGWHRLERAMPGDADRDGR